MSERSPAPQASTGDHRQCGDDRAGWPLVCELWFLSPEAEKECPGWHGPNLPSSTEELREYMATALEQFRDITLWGGVRQVGEGYQYVDTRQIDNDLRLQYANLILRNVNVWLDRHRYGDHRRPVFSGRVKSVVEADERLGELLQWLVCACGKQPGATEAGKAVGPAQKKRPGKRGRKPDTDLRDDKRVADGWHTSGCRTYAEYAKQTGRSETDVKQAIDRHRKRNNKRRKNSR